MTRPRRTSLRRPSSRRSGRCGRSECPTSRSHGWSPSPETSSSITGGRPRANRAACGSRPMPLTMWSPTTSTCASTACAPTTCSTSWARTTVPRSTLRYLDGLSVPEVAEHLGRTVHATEALLVRARNAFRVALRRGELRRCLIPSRRCANPSCRSLPDPRSLHDLRRRIIGALEPDRPDPEAATMPTLEVREYTPARLHVAHAIPRTCGSGARHRLVPRGVRRPARRRADHHGRRPHRSRRTTRRRHGVHARRRVPRGAAPRAH